MNANSAVAVRIESGGDGVAAHVGLHCLASFADRLGVGDCLSGVVPHTGERAPLHDRGKVLVQAMVMLAGGGEACADIERLRAQPDLFGSVPSDSTLFRTFHQLDDAVLAAVVDAIATTRRKAWSRMAVTCAGEVVLDIDSSLHTIHSENKEQTAATYKGGFGFHPIYCFADNTGEVLAVRLRPGNAGANNVADHVHVLDQAIAQLPDDARAGHGNGDDASLVRRPLRVRVDSAGCTSFVWDCRRRNVGFSVVARKNPSIQAAIVTIGTSSDRWQQAVRQDGGDRPGAAVAEITDLVDVSDWPVGTRVILRREPLHPGAQQSLFPSLEFRFWAHYTDQPGEPVELDVDMRAHAHCEQSIAALKDSGANRFPFTNFKANTAWLTVVCLADALVRWFQRLCLTGALAAARPKTMRWSFWHAPARIVRHARRLVVRVLTDWPSTADLLGAYQRVHHLTG